MDLPEAIGWGRRSARGATVIFVTLVAAWTRLGAVEPNDGGARTQDKARGIFALNVARSFPVKASGLTVSPTNETEERYAALKTGDLWCFEARDQKDATVARGFASAEGAVAFEGYKGGIGQPGGISALLTACGVLDKKRPMKIDKIIARIGWCLNRQPQGEMLYDETLLKRAGWNPRKEDRRSRISLKNGGAEIVYFTMKQGLTGTFDVGRVIVKVAPNYTATIERQETPL